MAKSLKTLANTIIGITLIIFAFYLNTIVMLLGILNVGLLLNIIQIILTIMGVWQMFSGIANFFVERRTSSKQWNEKISKNIEIDFGNLAFTWGKYENDLSFQFFISSIENKNDFDLRFVKVKFSLIPKVNLKPQFTNPKNRIDDIYALCEEKLHEDDISDELIIIHSNEKYFFPFKPKRIVLSYDKLKELADFKCVDSIISLILKAKFEFKYSYSILIKDFEKIVIKEMEREYRIDDDTKNKLETFYKIKNVGVDLNGNP